MGPIANIREMNDELRIRCMAAKLQFDCGCGGLFNADTAIIAEAPGDREVEQRLPLVGGTGKFLWDAIRREGITRTQVYITNVVKRRLLSVSDHAGPQKAPISQGELDHWNAILLEELSHLPNLRYVLACGNYAINALTGENGVTSWRGSVIPVTINGRVVQVVCCFNPAAILREPRHEITFRMDLNKLTRVRNGTYQPPQITEHINPTPAQAIDFIKEVRYSRLPVAYDIETIAGETACVGLANSNTEGMCINFRDARTNRFTLAEERMVRLELQALFADREMRFIAQNGMFDAAWLWFKDRIRVHRNWFDTMLAHHFLYPPLPHGLGYICSQYTDLPYFKDEGKEWREKGDIDEFWRYNVKDCVVTRIAAMAMREEIKKVGGDECFYNHIMRLQPHLVRMTVGGVKIDMSLKEQINESLARDLETKRQEFIDAVRTATGKPDYDINPRSPNQLRELLFTDLRLVGRGTSVDSENRSRMLNHPRTPEPAKEVIVKLDAFAEDSKFFSTYASSRGDSDGRFRCEYKQTGVTKAPGRLSSAGVWWGTGGNLQNQPDRAYPMFVCDDGYEFTYFDASQIEARIVAVLANITKWKEQFELARLNPGSYDAHCALASDMFKVPYDQVPKFDRYPDGRPTIRYVAKRCRHGLNYRMGPDRLATTAGLPISEAYQAYQIYHRETPELRVWWDATIHEVRTKRLLVSPYGRRWVLMQRLDDDILESIVAFRPQSTAGDKVASVIYLAQEDSRWPRDARVLLNVHDALITINRVEDGPLVRSILKEHMEAPIIINGEPLIIPSEFKVSRPDNTGTHRWSTLEKVAA